MFDIKLYRCVAMIKRELYLDKIRNLFGTDFIKVIVGLRRCGKTSLMKSIIEELQDQGVKKENIIYSSNRFNIKTFSLKSNWMHWY